MDRDVIVAWTAGVIEGEGCFIQRSAHSFSIQVCSVDEDVIDKLVKLHGGTKTFLKPRKATHQDAWRWEIFGKKAFDLSEEIRPHMLSRRTKKIDHMMGLWLEGKRKRSDRVALRKKILDLWATGRYTEKQVGELTGTNRSYVNSVRVGKLKT